MAGLLSTLLLVVAQQASPLPFEFELPKGYAAFTESSPATWTAAREDGNASFRVQYSELGAFGAIPEAVAEDIRVRFWEPALREVPHTMLAWEGTIDGLPGAGWVIDYRNGLQDLVVVQRLAIQGDRMVVLVWEGPKAARGSVETLFDGFTVPAEWLSIPPPEVDIYRGLGPKADMVPFPGELTIEVQAQALIQAEYIEVTVTYAPASGIPVEESMAWHLPAGSIPQPLQDDLGGLRTRYRLPLQENAGLGSPFGITRVGTNTFSALDPQWLALPSTEAMVSRLMPPAWTLAVLAPANLEPLSTTIASTDFDAATKALRTRFRTMPAGRAWPYFVLGDYELRQTGGVNWHLRLDSKASLEEEAMRELVRLQKALESWMPGGSPEWTMISFPWIGDRVLPGLIVLDEQRDWFAAPVDVLDGAHTRRVQLARLLCQERAGILRRGMGSASLFLDASLAEYLTWRLLLEAGNRNDADTLAGSWVVAEQQAGPLPMPLSLLEIGDLYGPRRLLSFGPMVWAAIERECGRPTFDALIGGLLASPGWWTTADLEARLAEAAPEVDWDAFFLRHVYGRELPSAE